MAPKKLDKWWNKLPKEVQCMIWKLKANEERVIRVESRAIMVSDHTKTVYYLTAGPVPKIMHICKESRAEGLRYYTPVRSRATMSLVSEYPPSLRREEYIFINFEIDTLMFTKMSSNFETYSWIRRIPREQKVIVNMIVDQLSIKKPDEENAEKKAIDEPKEKKAEEENTTIDITQVEKPLTTIQHIAFQAYDVFNWNARTSKLDFFYGLVMTLPQLKTMSIVMNGQNHFPVAKDPHRYAMQNIPMNTTHTTYYGDTLRKNKPTDVQILCRKDDQKIASIFHRIWENSVNMGCELGFIRDDLNQSLKYRSWREKEGEAWVPPAIETVRLAQSKKKNVRGH